MCVVLRVLCCAAVCRAACVCVVLSVCCAACVVSCSVLFFGAWCCVVLSCAAWRVVLRVFWCLCSVCVVCSCVVLCSVLVVLRVCSDECVVLCLSGALHLSVFGVSPAGEQLRGSD